jgi:hypothetical protein
MMERSSGLKPQSDYLLKTNSYFRSSITLKQDAISWKGTMKTCFFQEAIVTNSSNTVLFWDNHIL